MCIRDRWWTDRGEPKQVSVCGGSNITKNNEGIVDKVSGSNTSNYNDEIILNKNNNNIVENGVSKSDTVDNSENGSRMGVEVDQGLLVSAYDLEREYSCLLYTSRCV